LAYGGGGQLAASFQTSGLINEIHLAIIPIILGEGIPLIKQTVEETQLKLLESKSYKNGIVSVKYKVIKD
jgi:dihydrofolate reductase